LVSFFYFLKKKLYTGAGRVWFFIKNIEPILAMPVLINLRTAVIVWWFHKLIITFVERKNYNQDFKKDYEFFFIFFKVIMFNFTKNRNRLFIKISYFKFLS
jgi:hypothetical protein